MFIPSQFLPIRQNRKIVGKRDAVKFEKSESNADSTKQAVPTPVIQYDKREGSDRRKKKIKPLVDTRSGGDRRLEARKKRVDIKA